MTWPAEEVGNRAFRIGVLHLVTQGATVERLDDEIEIASKRTPCS